MEQYLDELETCIPSLRRYARALLRQREQADDLVQDCLERAIAKRKLWKPSGPLRPWLFTIMRNIHRDHLRKHRVQTITLDDMKIVPSLPAEQPDRLALNELASAIDRLPGDQRQVLLLVALEGFSYGETAKMLDIAVGTVMSRPARARKTLRQMRDGEIGHKLRRVK